MEVVVVVVAVVAAVCVERVGLVGFEVVVAVLAREIAVGGGCWCCCTAAIFVACLVFVSFGLNLDRDRHVHFYSGSNRGVYSLLQVVVSPFFPQQQTNSNITTTVILAVYIIYCIGI